MAQPTQRKTSVAHLRKEYSRAELLESDLDPNPFEQFRNWFDQAISAHLPEPTAMTLASATKNGRPSARIVLMKEFSDRGFLFFTNYESRKGKELLENPSAALLFHWVELERQVRIEGVATKISRKESEKYFRTRPTGSQLGAWASSQSEVIADRGVLERKLALLGKEFHGKEITMPGYWGGFLLNPSAMEFWQGRPNRLHDRLLYTRVRGTTWTIRRLSP